MCGLQKRFCMLKGNLRTGEIVASKQQFAFQLQFVGIFQFKIIIFNLKSDKRMGRTKFLFQFTVQFICI